MTLVLEAFGVRRGARDILSEVSARIAPTRVVGVVGPNGVGKSTFLSAVAGLLPHRGRVTWEGGALDADGIGFMPQVSQVRAALSVLETVLLGRYARLGWRLTNADLERAETALDAFGLLSLATRPINTLSGGQQQLVLLAQRLARDPRVLILDEATSALDPRHQMMVMDRLRAFAQSRGATVLIAMHDLNLAIHHADELMLLGPGGRVFHGAPGEVVTRESLRSVYGIEADILRGPEHRPVIVPLALASINPAQACPAAAS